MQSQFLVLGFLVWPLTCALAARTSLSSSATLHVARADTEQEDTWHRDEAQLGLYHRCTLAVAQIHVAVFFPKGYKGIKSVLFQTNPWPLLGQDGVVPLQGIACRTVSGARRDVAVFFTKGYKMLKSVSRLHFGPLLEQDSVVPFPGIACWTVIPLRM